MKKGSTLRIFPISLHTPYTAVLEGKINEEKVKEYLLPRIEYYVDALEQLNQSGDFSFEILENDSGNNGTLVITKITE